MFSSKGKSMNTPKRIRMLFVCYAFSVLIVHCSGIAEEYYDDHNLEDVPISLNNVSDSRRLGDDNLQNTTLEQNDTLRAKNQEDNYESDDEFKIFVGNQNYDAYKKEKIKLKSQLTTVKVSTIPRRLSYKIDPKDKTPSELHFLSDYEYVYEDDNEHQSLKDTQKPSTTTETINNTEENKTKVFLTDFYNLEPAAVIPELNQTFLSNQNMWYVPEKYPCWQLPILYGELGRRKKTSNIFLVKGGDLKNVNIPDKDKLRKYMLKPDVPTVSSLNKWCSVEPCYGDHTLCLFTENHVSKVCDENYRVHKPTILEHIAIVNTVNAMRNRIANGAADEYPQLPAAKNMKQIIYDYDLEKMAAAWLRQCLPGPPPCSALDERYVSQLECTKYADECCVNSYKIDPTSKCIPKDECFVSAVTGCIYAWFLSAGNKLSEKDIECGHIEPSTYNTVQLIWADSNKIGCAYGERSNGDIRVVCDFAPGAPYFLTTKYYCGFILHRDITDIVGADDDSDLTDLTFLSSLGLDIHSVTHEHPKQNSRVFDVAPKHPRKSWSLDSLQNLYSDLNLREVLNDYSSGTRGSIAKLVTRYRFFEESQSRCDTDEPVYVAGNPGSLCIEKGRRFRALCYDFRDPTPGYRLVAVVAPAALFSLILYDLFSGVVRQTNY